MPGSQKWNSSATKHIELACKMGNSTEQFAFSSEVFILFVAVPDMHNYVGKRCTKTMQLANKQSLNNGHIKFDGDSE